jgi:hypothetical protein
MEQSADSHGKVSYVIPALHYHCEPKTKQSRKPTNTRLRRRYVSRNDNGELE